METKICKHCQSTFEVTDDDLAFYDKVSPTFNGKKYSIPSPNLCPDCRMQRRIAFRNERSLYRRKCDASGQEIISIYSPDKSYIVYDQKIRRSDQFDPLAYSQDFDFTKTFAQQFDELNKRVPKLSIQNINSENCEYTNYSANNKNCYLGVGMSEDQDCYFCYRVFHSDNIVDGYDLKNCSHCYECLESKTLHDCVHCQNCYESNALMFCKNCTNCESCIGCVNLINKKYCIFNKQYSKEEYEKKSATIDFKSLQKEFTGFKLKFPVKHLQNINVQNCVGDLLMNCKNCQDSYVLKDSENCKYSMIGENNVNYQDSNFGDNCILQYDSSNLEANNTGAFGNLVRYVNDGYYLSSCFHSKDCFGCVGLKQHQYCLLNKQYSKADYETLVPQIIEHMTKTGERGEFFPSSLSPFGYNETVAQEYFPLTKEEALAKGFKRSDYEAPFPKGDGKDVVICEVSKKPFRLIPQEIEFYKKHNLPLPTKHPDVRHAERMKLRNPRKLFERKCAKCGIDIKTSYAPDPDVSGASRPEIVYCEACYNKEIYG